jgi:hypothetical protein
MAFELPVLVPPDDLPLERENGTSVHRVGHCQLLAHNVAPDGKANPISDDDPYFVFLYQHESVFYQVRGLNPEMMTGRQIPAAEADRLIKLLPYRVS